MSFSLANKNEFNKFLKDYSLRIEKALIYRLEFMVAELQNHAKESADYNDQTSNLKGSIGGVVLKDGRPVTYRGFEGTSTGKQQGKDFISELISGVGSGYIVIMVAGMEYATYVEDYHNLNVL